MHSTILKLLCLWIIQSHVLMLLAVQEGDSWTQYDNKIWLLLDNFAVDPNSVTRSMTTSDDCETNILDLDDYLQFFISCF